VLIDAALPCWWLQRKQEEEQQKRKLEELERHKVWLGAWGVGGWWRPACVALQGSCMSG